MNSLILCMLVLTAVTASEPNSSDRQEVINFLIHNGFINQPINRYSLKRALRQFQRENNLNINGQFSEETIQLVKTEKDKQMVLDYLKTFNYIQGAVTPLKTENAIKQVQQNSGVLSVTGVIDNTTVEFIKSHQQGYSDGLFPLD
jgi:hypothetical protein